MTQKLRVIAAITAVLTLLGACSSSGESKGKPTDEPLVVGVAQFGSETSLPWRMVAPEAALWQGVMEYLIMRDPKTAAAVPGLATEWTPSSDYRQWTFKLREGVKFHGDWGDFTSADVKYTIERALGQDAVNNASSFLRANLESAEVPDPLTVVLTLKSPAWHLPEYLTRSGLGLTMTSKKYVEEVGDEEASRHPIGTGPFQYEGGEQGSSHRFTAVADHWRVEPQFKKLEIRRLTDQATALSSLRAGEIDIAQVSGDYIDQAEGAGLRIHESKDATQYSLILPGQTTENWPDHCTECPWVGDANDPASAENARKVRMALNHAIDRRSIHEAIFRGYASSTPHAPWYMPFHEGYSDDWSLLPYDLDKAKSLLAEAGHPDGGFAIAINVMGDPVNGPDVVEAVASDWEKIGVTVKRVSEDGGTFTPKVRARDTKLIGRAYFNPTTIAPPLVSWNSLATSTGVGYYFAEGPYDEQIKAAMGEFDESKRLQMQSDIASQMQRGHHDVPIGLITVTWAVSDKVGKWPTIPGLREESSYEYITINHG